MRDRITSMIAIMLLAAVALTSYWYSREIRRPGSAEPPRPGTPGFIVDGVTLTQFDDTGQARYRLFSETLTHYSENDDIELARPRLVSLYPDRPQVQVRSERARVIGAGERVLMQGDVHVQRAGAAEQPALDIHTEQLVAFPDEDRYVSEAPVRIERGSDVLTGTQMTYDNVRRELTVQGKARAEIQPRDRSEAS